MQLDFSKADRLTSLIYDSSQMLWLSIYKGAYEMKNSTNEALRALYVDLVEITSSDKTKEEKNNLRRLAFANVYRQANDPGEGEHSLKFTFDEEAIVKRIAKSYWQLQTNLTIDWNYTSDDKARLASLRAFVDTNFPNEPYKEVIVETILLREPKIQDLEAEFWNNCPDIKSIDDLCNIYRERLRDKLIQVDLDFYKFDNLCFDNNNLLNQHLKDLRLCGLLQVSEAYVEARISHIAEEINKTSDGIVELFKRLRASSPHNILNQDSLKPPQKESYINNFRNHEDQVSSLPLFSDGCKTDLFNILISYFDKINHDPLLSLITNGIEPQQKLLFRDSGNKLTYALKEIFEARLITGVNKKQLEEWVIRNFQFLKTGKTVADYRKDAVHVIISGNSSPAKNPILKIVNNKIEKAIAFTKRGKNI
ncbi:MAG: hypothetical protein KF870_07260 [Leadbetterella sp.]|nr:hypothetical protein [Leadbetterella sp.]